MFTKNLCVYVTDIVKICAMMELIRVTFPTASSAVFCMLFIFASAKLNENDILLLNKPLDVDFGRTVFLDPISTLRINVRSGDFCRVILTNNEEMTYRAGRVSKSEFSCNFGPEEVQYIHYGGGGLPEDNIHMLLRYNSHHDNRTTIIPFSTKVRIHSKPSQVLFQLEELTVERHLGLSIPIDPLILAFNYDQQRYRCIVSILSPSFGLPQFGELLNNTNPVSNVECDVFLTLGISYKHTSESRGSNMDFIPLHIRLLENDGEIFYEEYVQLRVNILSGRRNSAPQPSENSIFIMYSYNQMGMTAITPDVVSATDAETPSDRLFFKITQPLGPGEGYIINTDNRYSPISSFYQHDINDLKIAYRSPSSDSSIQRIVQLGLTIFDPHGLASDPIQLMIIVKPRNPSAPHITKNTGIQLFKGGFTNLSLDILGIADEDNLRQVTINHIHGMSNGFLTLSTGNSYFTYEDLRKGRVQYHHDGSETSSDNVIFSMSDGANEVEFLFPVTVYPVDRKPPGLVINTAIDVQKHGLMAVASNILSAVDMDTDNSHLKFILEKPYSPMSLFIKRQYEIPTSNLNDWHFEDGIYEKTVSEFTQEDIYRGRIFYKYVGAQNQNALYDHFNFHLKDNGSPPNKSPTFSFAVNIHPIDDNPPRLTSNTGLQLEIGGSKLVQIKRKHLRYSDEGTGDRDIVYIIKRQPVDANNASDSDAGAIVNCDAPERRLYRITQVEINHLQVCFQPPRKLIGITTKLVQFWFDVSDQVGNSVENQHFNILLKPVKNNPPSIYNVGAEVTEYSQVIITERLFRIDDDDTPLNRYVLKLCNMPQHGAVYMDSQHLMENATFSYTDIENGRIIYANTGLNNNMMSDNFTVEVIDGAHIIPVTFKIRIKNKDIEKANVGTSARGGSMVLSLELYEIESMELGSDLFRFADINDISYIVKRHPRFGEILRHGSPSSFFTQSDVVQGYMKFQMSDRETGRDVVDDYIQLTFADDYNILLPDNSVLMEITIRLRILPVDNKKPEIKVLQNIEVAEGERVAILPSHFEVTDIDTEEHELLCIIVEQPENGHLQNIGLQFGTLTNINPISSFTVGDIRMGKIVYVQSIHKSVEPRRDSFKVQCSDGKNPADPVELKVVIRSKNDEEPNVAVRGFRVKEGGEIVIDSSIIDAIDYDEPKDPLTVKITKEPIYGSIVKKVTTGNVPLSNFNLQEIKQNSKIFYIHDDSESKSDSFEFVVTDGVHEGKKVLPIDIIPIDDEAPRIVVNNGLIIDNIKESKVITNDDLKAEDVDSPEDNITFIIERIPKYGYLTKNTKGGIQNLTYSSNFTQNEIDQSLIHYVHTGSEATRDIVVLYVSDGVNRLSDRSFQVTIKGLDVIYPDVVSRGVQLPEHGIKVLSADLLGISEGVASNRRSKFTIIKQPVHGHLTLSDQPGIFVEEFLYADVAQEQLQYVHDADDAIKVDSFELEVFDNVKKLTQTYRITLTSVDNKLPVVMFSNLRLEEGRNKVITPHELKAVDSDTADDLIIFTITQVPLHGNLLYNFSRIVTRFSQKDLNYNLITYQHDGTETMSDSFIFIVTDGTHLQYFVHGASIPTRRPQEMDIVIIPVDSGIPIVKVNKDAMTLTSVDIGVGFTFTNEQLQCDDKDSDVKKLRYTISVPPKHGFIRNINRGGIIVLKWTQGEIDNGHIQYVLNQGENATSDNFFFKVTDEDGNSLENQPFNLMWAWLSFQSSHIKINETQGVLDVTLLRRGYLGQTSNVTINVTEHTASIGRDLSRQFQKNVTFSPGQGMKHWVLQLVDDDVYEGEETVMLQMIHPTADVLEFPQVAMVTIVDPEDESTVFFPKTLYHVQETLELLEVLVHRAGDLTKALEVICYTRDDTANGSPNNAMTQTDYVVRPAIKESIIRFEPGEKNKTCGVMVSDDYLYEEEEKFYVVLYDAHGGRIGDNDQATIIIEPDSADEPGFSFDEEVYHVDESVGKFEVKVWKTGTDLSRPSSVTVKSRLTNDPSAQANMDYLPVMRILDFAPGQMTKTLTVTILDDLGRPQLEGIERFELYLYLPVGGSIKQPSVATVHINDTISDLPKMEFAASEYRVLESEGEVVAIVTRSGDIETDSYVRCITLQVTAESNIDFTERPNNNGSNVYFKPNERTVECRVPILDDSDRENEESFRLILINPGSTMARGATLGGQTTTRILLDDPEDRPIIQFDPKIYTVNEPMIKGDMNVVKVRVVRVGDVSKVSMVEVSTKSGSATAGRDFNSYKQEFVFGSGESEKMAEIEILYDTLQEDTETFLVTLSQDAYRVAYVGPETQATVYIEQKSQLADVILPEAPVVVSLQDYNDVEVSDHTRIIQGYPLVCVSPCHKKHPQFSRYKRQCRKDNIDDSLTKFRWLVAPPGDSRLGDLREVEMNTAFTSTRQITLDSVYFTGGSRVQCYARAVTSEGDPGRERGSNIVTVLDFASVCQSQDHTGQQPYIADLHYIGEAGGIYENTVRLSVQIAHRDGMLPIISTHQFSNLQYTLNQDGPSDTHGPSRCSNLAITQDRIYGFIENRTAKEWFPSQLDDIRGERNLKLYRNLDLKNCVWTFTAYFPVSDLVNSCGATLSNYHKVLNTRQSYMTLSLPLHVYYVYYSKSQTPVSWTHYHSSTHLHLMFLYTTQTIWNDGIQAKDTSQQHHGMLYPTSIKIADNKRLSVTFRTQNSFHGTFVKKHPLVRASSSVVSQNSTGVDFYLTLLHTDDTTDQPEQVWKFTSQSALGDYSGDYHVNLLPCVAPATSTPYTNDCTPAHHVTFDLPIRLQQITNPVMSKYSLGSKFVLLRRRDKGDGEKWGNSALGEESAFVPGDTVYGQVTMATLPPTSHHVRVDKVVLCTGEDGHIPTYNPENGEYGCQGEHITKPVIRILDFGKSASVKAVYSGEGFQAQMSPQQNPAVHSEPHNTSWTGGFSFSSAPLFQMDVGKQWFVHVFYTVFTCDNEEQCKSGSHTEGKQGSNIAPLFLNIYGEPFSDSNRKEDKGASENGVQLPLIAALIGAGIFLLIGGFILVICIRHRRKKASPPPSPSGTITVMSTSTGQTRVISNAHIFTNRDSHTHV